VEKILIIRLSSFGDIIQALVVLEGVKKRFPNSEIHWLIRSDFKELIDNHPLIDKVHHVAKGSKFAELKLLAKDLKKEGFTRVYDAHNNTRSNLLGLFFLLPRLLGKIKWLERPKNRFKRLLLFKLRINLFPWPFVLMKSYLAPLAKWKVSKELTKNKHLYIDENSQNKANSFVKDLDSYICFAPSAAWELKRWPIEYWQKLSELLPDENIVFLGGPGDDFIENFLMNSDPQRSGKMLNLAGKLSYAESCSIIENAKAIVGGDSGLTHAGDSFGIPTFCIIGAAAFAYPARSTTRILDHKLSCKPCSKDGRGKCINSEYKACLFGITPEMISAQIKALKPKTQ
jgi:heptosyltransferase-2